jgi:hypothetical protein
MVCIPLTFQEVPLTSLDQNDFPQLKYALLGVMGLFALIQRE